jgi:hypothetical protein
MIRCSKPGPTTSCWPSSAAMSLTKASRSATGLAASTGQIRERAVAVAIGPVGSRQALHIKAGNAPTGLWFRLQSSPFRRMPRPDSAGAAGAIFLGAGPRQRSLEDLLLGQLELHLQLRPLRYGRRPRRKVFARAPPRMAIHDVPFKRAVRASMPPHVEKYFAAPRPAHLMNLFQLRPDFPNVPPFPELRLSLFQSRHTVRERHGVIDQNQRRLSGSPRVA